MSINKIILILALFNLYLSAEPPTKYDDLKCGKDNPKDEDDCTDYGTGSGMVCCWISKPDKKNGICRLVPDDIARASEISPSHTFTSQNEYWNCGNGSYYLYLTILNILLFFILL